MSQSAHWALILRINYLELEDLPLIEPLAVHLLHRRRVTTGIRDLHIL